MFSEYRHLVVQFFTRGGSSVEVMAFYFARDLVSVSSSSSSSDSPFLDLMCRMYDLVACYFVFFLPVSDVDQEGCGRHCFQSSAPSVASAASLGVILSGKIRFLCAIVFLFIAFGSLEMNGPFHRAQSVMRGLARNVFRGRPSTDALNRCICTDGASRAKSAARARAQCMPRAPMYLRAKPP